MVSVISSSDLISTVRSLISVFLHELCDLGELEREEGRNAQSQLDDLVLDLAVVCDIPHASGVGKRPGLFLDGLEGDYDGTWHHAEVDDLVDALVGHADAGRSPRLKVSLDADDCIERITGLLRQANALTRGSEPDLEEVESYLQGDDW